MELSCARQANCRLSDATVSNDTKLEDLKLVWNVLDDLNHSHRRSTRMKITVTSLTNQSGVATSMGKDVLSGWRMEEKAETLKAFWKGA